MLHSARTRNFFFRSTTTRTKITSASDLDGNGQTQRLVPATSMIFFWVWVLHVPQIRNDLRALRFEPKRPCRTHTNRMLGSGLAGSLLRATEKKNPGCGERERATNMPQQTSRTPPETKKPRSSKPRTRGCAKKEYRSNGRFRAGKKTRPRSAGRTLRLFTVAPRRISIRD